MKTMEERLEALEHSVRRWRTVTAILALNFVASEEINR